MSGELDIDYIEFDSSDLETSRAFFEKAFGWKFTDFGPDYIGLDNGAIDGGISRAVAVPRPPLVILYADDLDAAQASVLSAGGEITAPQYDFPGGRRFHFREPGGNELAVWSAPKDQAGKMG